MNEEEGVHAICGNNPLNYPNILHRHCEEREARRSNPERSWDVLSGLLRASLRFALAMTRVGVEKYIAFQRDIGTCRPPPSKGVARHVPVTLCRGPPCENVRETHDKDVVRSVTGT